MGATLTAIDGGKKTWYRRRSETASREPCGWHSLDHPESGQDTGEIIINTEAWLCSPLEIAGAGMITPDALS